MVKDLPAYAGNTGDESSVPGLGRSPGGGNGVCSSILTWESPMARGAWQATVHGVQSLGWDDPLEEEMATHSSTFAWKIPGTEEPCRLQSMGLHRVRHKLGTEHACMTMINY